MTMSLRKFPCIAALCLLQGAHADVPNAISYQGRALTASGALMGAGTPITRTATFRIWGSASNSLTSDLLYSEQQVVTLAELSAAGVVLLFVANFARPLVYAHVNGFEVLGAELPVPTARATPPAVRAMSL